MKGVTSREFLEEFRMTKRSFKRLQKFMDFGGPKEVLEDEILLLIKHAITLRWIATVEPREMIEPKGETP